jgi:predicted HAD superfamily Cof-like phosphohydrolase
MPQYDFFQSIKEFNQMYGIPTPEEPMLDLELHDRLIQFKTMLLGEVAEVDDVIRKMETATYTAADVLTEVSDWLGDIIVYCASEAARHGLPIRNILQIIMDSNASKLQLDGTAKFVDGKLQKGPGYWKPEPQIKDLLVRSVK